MSSMPLAIVNYPVDLPLPQMEPYDWEVGLGLSQLKMNAGNTLIRRRWKHLPHTFNFTFGMTTDQMTRFVVFMDVVGADWFNIESLSMYTGTDDTVIKPQPVRFISGMNVSAMGYNWWQISILAELSPEVFEAFEDILGNNWIIGRTPDNPSPDWVIAGTPVSPSVNWVIAGTPAEPSGWV